MRTQTSIAAQQATTADEQLRLSRRALDDGDGPEFDVSLEPRKRPGDWLINARMKFGVPILDVQISYVGWGAYEWPRSMVMRGTHLQSPLGDLHRQQASTGGSVLMRVTEKHIEPLILTIMLVSTEVLDVEDPSVARAWPKAYSRTAEHPNAEAWNPPIPE